MLKSGLKYKLIETKEDNMMDKMAMQKAAMDMLSKIKDLDMSKVSSVTISFSDMSDEEHEASEEEYEAEGDACEYCGCDAKRRGGGACCDRCGNGECPDCGAEMEDNMCPECEYEDTDDQDLWRMKHKYGIPHMMKMKEHMKKGMSPMEAHKKVAGKAGPKRLVEKLVKKVDDTALSDAVKDVNKLEKPEKGRVG